MRILPSLALLAAAGCGQALQRQALRTQADQMCTSMTHPAGEDCQKIVAERFDACVEPFLAKTTTSEAFAACLGFAPAPTSVLVTCAPPTYTLPMSLTLARDEVSATTTVETIGGRVLYLAPKPFLTQADVQAVTLETSADLGDRVVFTLTSSGASRLLEVTTANVGAMVVTRLGDTTTSARVVSPIAGPEISLAAGGITPAQLCPGS